MIEKMMGQNIIHYYIINCAIPSTITIKNHYQIDFGKPSFWDLKTQKWPIMLPASILEKYFNFRIHQCFISMVSSLFLGTAYMFLCNNGIATAGLQLVGNPNIS